jgi:localization factor PodJL
MASDVTWNMKGLAPEVRETAREAARRAGLSVAEWLQSVIIDSAADAGVTRGERPQSASRHDEPQRRDRRARENSDRVAHDQEPDPNGHMRAIDARLEALSEQLDRLARAGTETSIPPQRLPTVQPDDAELKETLRSIEAGLAEFTRQAADRMERPAQQVADALAQLDRRLDSLMADGRTASSELENRIAAVDRALAALARDGAPWTDERSVNGDAAARDPAASFAAPPPETQLEPTEIRPALSVPRYADPAAVPQSQDETAPPSTAPDFAALGFDEALAEIAARQEALEAEAEPRQSLEQQFARLSERLTTGAAGASGTAGDFSGLQQQIHQLTEQLESWRGPGDIREAIAGLRQELAEIGRKLTEAAPRCAVEALEAEMRVLAERIDAGRHQGADAANLAGLERGLADVRDALQRLAPAESLTQFREDVRALDHRIEQISAEGPDAAALGHIQASVAELRQIASRAASGEALIALAEEVQALGDKIDGFVAPAVSGTDIFSGLDQRFQELAATFEARVAAADTAGTHDLVSLVEALAHRLERVELAGEAMPALDRIAAQLGQLTERLEASGARLDNLEGVERSLSELFDRLESVQVHAAAAGERAGKEAALEAASASASATFEVEALRHDLDAVRQGQVQSDRRTQDTMEAVHDTLERLVDRLATVETEIRGDTPRIAAAPAEKTPEDTQRTPIRESRLAAQLAPVTVVPSERRPIDPTLPADHPLEPGSAAPRVRPPVSAAERIAASEAALSPIKVSGSETESKANFIAAARRAAQAAATMAGPSLPGGEAGKAGVSTLGAIAQKITRRRPLLLGLAILAIAGTLHLVLNVLGPGEPQRSDAGRPVATEAAAPTSEPSRATSAKPISPMTSLAPAPQSGTLPSPLSLAPPAGPTSAAVAAAQRDASAGARRPARQEPAAARESSETAPHDPGAAPAAGQESRTTTTVSPLTIASIKLPAMGDITGSTGRAAGFTLSNAAPMPAIGASGAPASLPGAIPPGLRTAAAEGNPAAEFEMGMRHAEGRGVPLNLEEAARWFERAADRGIVPAQYRLGSLYEKGQGVKKDLEKARRLYTAAAEKGNAKAMHNLAVLHADGSDDKPDFKAASYWFRKAAERGVADSQYNLGILHARGLGAEQNLAESYKWFALAAQQGDQDAGKKRDDIASRLDQHALIAARLAVQTFTAEPQPADALSVKTPEGGWESAVPAAPRAKPKTGASTRGKLGAT